MSIRSLSALYVVALAGLFSCVVTVADADQEDDFSAFPAVGIEGRAMAIDGDTLIVTRPNGSELSIRLWGIDAPEIKDWPWGPRARAALDSWIAIGGGRVVCKFKGGKTHNRQVAQCATASPGIRGEASARDLGEDLIAWGLAIEWRSYSRGFYASSECFARKQRRGLWSDPVFVSAGAAAENPVECDSR